MEKTREIPDLPEPVRALVGECELTGKRTFFTRNGSPVVALVSYDEYLALRETVEIANDDVLRAHLREADAEAQRGALMEVQDLE